MKDHRRVPQRMVQRRPTRRIVKPKEGNNFLRGMGIYISIFAVLAISVLTFLWFFMAAYEKSLPENALTAYTSDGGAFLLKEAAAQSGEDTEKLDYLYSLKLDGKTITCRKKTGEYSVAAPVYSVCVGGEAYFTLELEKGKSLGFGMNEWVVKSLTADEAYFVTEVHTLSVVVPSNAVVTVNGQKLGGEYIVRQNIAYSEINPYDKADSSLVCTKYAVAEIFTPPSVSVEYEGVSLSPISKSDYSYVFMPGETYSVTVKAPSNANVAVNGYLLTEEYIIDSKQYDDVLAEEKETMGLPCEVTYRIDGMFGDAEVKADLDGTMLEIIEDDNNYSFAYPDEAKYTISVRVPKGADLYIGKQKADESRIHSEIDMPRLEGLESYIGELPKMTLYSFDGLYIMPSFSASDSEGSLDIYYESFSGKTGEIDFARFSNSEHDTEKLLELLKLYVKYTAYGNQDTQQNYNALLPYIVSSSPVAKIFRESLESVKWNSAMTDIKYNDIGVRNFVDYGDNCYTCELYCDVMLSRWNNQRQYVSSWDVTCVKTANGWLVWEMTTK